MLWGAIAACCWASPGWGDPPAKPASEEPLQKLSLEELMGVEVSTVSRVNEPNDWAPGTIYVFSRSVIQQRGYRSLGELLQVVPGFTVFHRDLQYVVGVRGLNGNDNDKVSLLLNGHRILGGHEQEFLNGPINLDNVERVEVVVGPSSLFQQADTLAATINLITRNIDGAEAFDAIGPALPYSATVMAGKQWESDKFIQFAFTTEEKDGFDAWSNPSRPYLPGRKVTGELDWPSFFGVLNGQLGELTSQVVAYRAARPELHIDGADPNNNGSFVDGFYSVYAEDDHPWSDRLTSIVDFETALREQTRLNANGLPRNALQITTKQWLYKGELGMRYTSESHHQVQVGAQASYQHNFDTYATFLAPDQAGFIPKNTLVSGNALAVGFYADDEWQWKDWLKLVLGARVDHSQVLEGPRWYPAWRSAIVCQFFSSWVAKLVYNRAVRFPSALFAMNEVWGSNHPDTPNNPPFARLSPTVSSPETLSTLELENIFHIGKVLVEATVYHQELQDFISWFNPGSNGGNFRGNGAELNIQAPFSSRFTLWANGSWNDSKLLLFRPEVFGVPSNTPENFHAYVNPDDRLIGSARYIANLGCDWKLRSDLGFSPSVRYFTEQAAVEFHTQDEGGPRFITIDNRAYLDATLSWQAWSHPSGSELNLRLSGYNLTDNREPVAVQQFADTYRPRGISVVLGVDLRF